MTPHRLAQHLRRTSTIEPDDRLLRYEAKKMLNSFKEWLTNKTMPEGGYVDNEGTKPTLRVTPDPPDTDESHASAERLTKALKVVEAVAGENQTLPKNLDTEREKQLHGAIGQIYRVAHAAREPECMSAHEDWEDELQELIDLFDA